MAIRLSCYGRFTLIIERTDDARWRVMQAGDDGKRRLREDIVIPPHVPDANLETYLDDLLHELGGPGHSIRRL